VYTARDKNYEVTIGFEYDSRHYIKYLVNLHNIVQGMGAKRVKYADTVGALMSSVVKQSIRSLIDNTGIEIEIHAHNDFGMAIPISIEVVKNDAKYADCTLDGIEKEQEIIICKNF
jgi:homocitrate synthase NifV